MNSLPLLVVSGNCVGGKKRRRRRPHQRQRKRRHTSTSFLFQIALILLLQQIRGDGISSDGSTTTTTTTRKMIVSATAEASKTKPTTFVRASNPRTWSHGTGSGFLLGTLPRGGAAAGRNDDHQEEEKRNTNKNVKNNRQREENKNNSSSKKKRKNSKTKKKEQDGGDDEEGNEGEAIVDNNNNDGTIEADIMGEEEQQENSGGGGASTIIGNVWPSLFHLNNAIKDLSDGDDDVSDTGDDEDEEDSAVLLGADNGRGGALVKTAVAKHNKPPPQQQQQRNIFFQWLAPPPSTPPSSDHNGDVDTQIVPDENIKSIGSDQKPQDEDYVEKEEGKDESPSKEEGDRAQHSHRNNNSGSNDGGGGNKERRRKHHKHHRRRKEEGEESSSSKRSSEQEEEEKEETAKTTTSTENGTTLSTDDDEQTGDITDDGIGHSRRSPKNNDNDNKGADEKQEQQQQTDTKTDEHEQEPQVEATTDNNKQEGINVDSEPKIIRTDDSIEEEMEADSNTTTTASTTTTAEPSPLEETSSAGGGEGTISEDVSPFVSSGYWPSIDKALTFGYASNHPGWRVSSRLRPVRKATARITGLHGVLSGKRIDRNISVSSSGAECDDGIGALMRRRIAAIDRARANVAREERRRQGKRRGRGFWGRQQAATDDDIADDANEQFNIVVRKSKREVHEERRRKERVKEIDRLISESQKSLQQLACEKDVLQRRPNPLWNYTIDAELESSSTNASATLSVSAERKFSFPPPDLVDEYLEMLFSSGRLEKLNHTDLWKNNNGVIYDDDDDDDELSSSPNDYDASGRRRRNGNGGSGNWLLRHGLGEKIGVAVETAAYKSVCAGVMSFLARSLSSLHGVNVMDYSDIRLYVEQAPDLPPLAAGIIPGSGKHANYAQGALEKAMRKGAKKRKRRHSKMHRSPYETFIQRDAVVETLLSQCQIAAPLLKLFPIAWQRAMLANCISMITAIFADFFEGLEFQILGHRLSFVFSPITEADMLRNLRSVGEGFNRNRPRPEQFEAAVKATAESLAEELKFLDKWHERALGGDVLKTQIANLIARLVLSLTDDVLRGARIDLWAAHAGGPRLLAGLEYRTTPNYMDLVDRLQ